MQNIEHHITTHKQTGKVIKRCIITSGEHKTSCICASGEYKDNGKMICQHCIIVKSRIVSKPRVGLPKNIAGQTNYK